MRIEHQSTVKGSGAPGISRLTERLIQVACIALFLFLLWTLAERTFVAVIQANQRAIIAEQKAGTLEGQLQQCRSEKSKAPEAGK